MNAPGYEQLSEVLRAAFDQAAYGKGAERHARGNDFDKQHMQTISTLLGTERGMAFQACKKLAEGLDMEAYDRFERELLGVIIYTAGIIIWRKKNQLQHAAPLPIDPDDVVFDDTTNREPSEWIAGDVVECINTSKGEFTKGEFYTLRSKNVGFCAEVVADDSGDENGWGEHNFRFHSRPTK